MLFLSLFLLISFSTCSTFSLSQSPLQRSSMGIWEAGSADLQQFNVTDNLIFSSIASLLQQWPNTLWRNGHTIIKGHIPSGTILYHGRHDSEAPTAFEWLAFNFEHSYLLCQSPECWMLTFAVREKINILYFDGSSASNSLMGHLDSQDVLLWGKVRPEKLLDEVGRIRSLCAWGAPFGLDGFVRMEPGFELMLCDFSKLRLVSSARIHAPDRSKERGWNTRDDHGFGSIFQRRAIRRSNSVLLPPGGPPSREPPGLPPIPPPPPPVPPNWRGPFRTGHSVEIETCLAAAWNNFYPGEARVKLDYTRMVSFYDPSLTSLLPSRDGLPKNRHRLVTLSKDDAKLAMDRLEDDLNRKSGDPSADWSMLLRTVMDRYGDRLWLLRDTLSSPERYDSIKLAAEQVRLQVFVMLTPYLVYDAVPDEDSPTGGKDHSWVKPIIHRCSTSLTAGVDEAQLFRSEKLIKRAIDGVLRRICSTLGEIWADAMPVSMASEHRTHRLIGSWKRDVDVLMTWLDWPMWETCHPACPPQMFCYIPTWPWGVEWTEMDPDDIDMAPRCIDRTTGSLILPRF